jgi:transcriptional regulator with XRE-family HTH domain
MRQSALSSIGQTVRQARRAKRLSQDRLAELSGVSRPRIAALEGDKITDITFGNLLSILQALDLDLRVVPLSRKRPTLEELRADEGETS